MFNPEMLPHVTPPQTDVKSTPRNVREELETMMDSMLDSMLKVILDDPTYPEENKEPIRVTLSYSTADRLLSKKLRKLGNPELAITDDLRYARCEAVQVMSQFIQSAEELISKYPNVFNEI